MCVCVCVCVCVRVSVYTCAKSNKQEVISYKPKHVLAKSARYWNILLKTWTFLAKRPTV